MQEIKFIGGSFSGDVRPIGSRLLASGDPVMVRSPFNPTRLEVQATSYLPPETYHLRTIGHEPCYVLEGMPDKTAIALWAQFFEQLHDQIDCAIVAYKLQFG